MLIKTHFFHIKPVYILAECIKKYILSCHFWCLTSPRVLELRGWTLYIRTPVSSTNPWSKSKPLDSWGEHDFFSQLNFQLPTWGFLLQEWCWILIAQKTQKTNHEICNLLGVGDIMCVGVGSHLTLRWPTYQNQNYCSFFSINFWLVVEFSSFNLGK